MRYFIAFLLWLAITGCSNGNDILILEGKLTVKGFVPHTFLSIEDKQSHKNYEIENPNQFNLIHRQKEIIIIKAKLIKKAVGPGFPAIIKILEVK